MLLNIPTSTYLFLCNFENSDKPVPTSIPAVIHVNSYLCERFNILFPNTLEKVKVLETELEFEGDRL